MKLNIGKRLVADMLLSHIVAPFMVWIDGPDNEWRTIMLPLALRCPPLLFAILALSAEHYASKTGREWKSDDENTSVHFRTQSMRILAQDLRAEMSRANAMVSSAGPSISGNREYADVPSMA